MKIDSKHIIIGLCISLLLGAIIIHTMTVDHSARAQAVTNYLLERHLENLFD